MPRRRLCQHPTRHTNSSISKGTRRVSYRLLNFMRNHYDLEELNIRWLCPKCQRVETEIMNKEYSMEEENNMNTGSGETSGDDSTDDEKDISGSDQQDSEEEQSDDEKDNSGSDQQDSEEKQSDEEMLLELTYQQEQAMEQLSAVFKLLNMDPIHDKLRTTPIRSRVDEVYRYLHGLCDVFEGKLAQVNDPNPHDLLVQESNEFLTGLKKLFNESDNTEQVRLLTIAPKEWGREKIRKWFESTEHQARQSLVLRDNEDILAVPQYLSGNPPMSDDTITTIIDFYREDGISRISSNSKDTIQINRITVPIRFMEMSVLNAFRLFDERFPGLVGRSTFYSIRPRDVKIVSPHDTCICITHENMNLLIKAWNNYCHDKHNKSSSKICNTFVLNELIDQMVCNNDMEDCFVGECQLCSTKSIIDILTRKINVDLDENCSWTIWKKLDTKFDLQQVTSSVEALLDQIEEKWPAFLLHTFCNRRQREYIADLRVQSSRTTFIVAQVDFSMNYNLIRQREVQQAFFSQKQASIFTIHITIGKEHRDIAIISNSMEHSVVYLYCAQKILADYLKKNIPFVKKIIYVSDGASHFKNNANILNLAHHKNDFALEAAWVFTASGHGKGAGDGIGAVLKSTARRTTLTKNIVLSSPYDFYEFSKKHQLDTVNATGRNQPAIDVFFLEEKELQKIKVNVLDRRQEQTKSRGVIRGIRGMHDFKVLTNNTVCCRRTSSSLHYETYSFQ